MELNNIEEIASYIVSDGKGILAADESNPTCGKRFDTIGVENIESNRRDYREMLFRASGLKDNIGGVILFDETLRQNAKDGTPLIDIMNAAGALPGIKVDKGLIPISDGSDEVITQGLDGLNDRLKEYVAIGAKFTKWRAVIKIGNDMPSDQCIDGNADALAEYAKLAQNNGLVPIVEPEILMDGDHTIDQSFNASSRALASLFNSLKAKGVNLKGVLLKPSMVTPGSEATLKASVEDVANMTLKSLKENVPAEVPGITFLSGGQTEIEATQHLDAMNKIGGFSWKLSFSFGRALQAGALKAWSGDSGNAFIAQDILSHRAKMNNLAAQGDWIIDLEEEF
ncbi:MAG: fructose-bisphosphate aldolase class I [SAR86 cluster bacterium]|nr:fructose-bisphosphate aldolase class I [SAR86 cluster bacterium]MDG2092576.1 fructose-bisphosphate aldolase class I [SAR86 cluster bacterium]|tara:strand:- start:6192 stop:7211 length:1020 start_codon:yes stop_codon:yes gene_type:complete